MKLDNKSEIEIPIQSKINLRIQEIFDSQAKATTTRTVSPPHSVNNMKTKRSETKKFEEYFFNELDNKSFINCVKPGIPQFATIDEEQAINKEIKPKTGILIETSNDLKKSKRNKKVTINETVSELQLIGENFKAELKLHPLIKANNYLN